MSRALTTTRWPSCCKANTNGQVVNARRLAYRNTTLHRTTPDYVLGAKSDLQHARSVHFSADGMVARMSEHRPRGYTLALAYELQVAHRMALQHLGQWPRHALSGTLCRNRTCCQGRGGRECLTKQYNFKGLQSIGVITSCNKLLRI